MSRATHVSEHLNRLMQRCHRELLCKLSQVWILLYLQLWLLETASAQPLAFKEHNTEEPRYFFYTHVRNKSKTFLNNPVGALLGKCWC